HHLAGLREAAREGDHHAPAARLAGELPGGHLLRERGEQKEGARPGELRERAGPPGDPLAGARPLRRGQPRQALPHAEAQLPLAHLPASAAATRAATSALFLSSAAFASSERPPVSRATAASRKGVTSLPRTPAASASASARPIASSTAAAGRAVSSGGETHRRSAPGVPSRSRARHSSATSPASSTRTSTGRALSPE